ncbi:MAG: MFS transporter [Sphingomonadaceae bacterium]
MSVPSHPLAIPVFRAFLIARTMIVLAQNALVVVIGWQVYDIARETMDTKAAALQLGLVGMAQFLPLLLLTLVVGWTADHVDRRFIARAVVLLEVGCGLSLALLTRSGAMTLPALFAVAALLGVARAFAGPAFSALGPNLVPPTLLPRAIALNSTAWQIGAVLGPAVGGYLYAIDHPLPYFVAAGLFGIALLSLLTIGPVPRPARNRDMKPWHQMIEGMRYVRHNRLVLGAISLDLFAVLLGGATAMLPIYARDILKVGPEGLGHLRAAPAIGAGLTALWLSFRPLTTNVGPKMLVGVALFGAATIIFGLSRSMTLSFFSLIILGIGDMVSVFVRQSLIQIYTPDAMRGRVSAVSTLFISGSNELGEAESGFLAALMGPVAAVVAGGVGAIAITFLWARWFPELRNARTFDPPDHLVEKLRETTT